MPSILELGSGRNDTATIQRDGRAIHVCAGATAQEETGAGDVLRTADPAERDVRLNVVLETLERRLHHFGLEWPTRNDVGPARQTAVSTLFRSPQHNHTPAFQPARGYKSTYVMPRLPRWFASTRLR